ncbi:MAG: VOC family protein [Anaerolineales bacterium]|nr:VOC family protein [Anaerolineales bacterium]
MTRVVQFEIAADEPERAIAFYSSVFGWRFERWDGPIEYWLITTNSPESLGITGGLVRRRGPMLAPENTIGVDEIDEAVNRVQTCGGKILRPKAAIDGIGWIAYCQDTEGNSFSVMQADPSA